MKLKITLLFITTIGLASCDQLLEIQKEIEKQIPTTSQPLSLSEIVQGLKQALEVGTSNSVKSLNVAGGYFNNPKIKIPFPADAQNAADKLRQLGMNTLVDNFIKSLNSAAEDAAYQAKPIFISAIKNMSFDDARKILSGPDNAATNFFKKNTRTALYNAFKPKINGSLKKVKVTQYWSEITSTYNKIPMVSKVNTNLDDYATNKALDGLFLMVESEEKKIRQDPAARVTDLLKKVFAS